MNNFLKILQIIPALISIIRSIEEIIPDSGKGKEKLALVEKMMTAAYAEITDLWPTIEKIVAAIVETANLLGVFKK